MYIFILFDIIGFLSSETFLFPDNTFPLNEQSNFCNLHTTGYGSGVETFVLVPFFTFDIESSNFLFLQHFWSVLFCEDQVTVRKAKTNQNQLSSFNLKVCFLLYFDYN